MSNYFRGESNLNVHYSVKLKDLSPLKRTLAVLCFVLWIPFAVLLFVPDMFKLGVAGIIASTFVYIPAALMYIIKPKGAKKTVFLILIGIGVLGIAGYLVVSACIENGGSTLGLISALCGTVIFLGFFIPGICMLAAGIKRNKKWKTYSLTVTAIVVGYKNIKTGMFQFDNIAPGLNNPMDQTAVYSPVIQYSVNGVNYRGETDSYFGASQIPAVGQPAEIHVDPQNHRNFIMRLQTGGLLVAGGISFIAVGVAAVIVAAILSSFSAML